MLEKILVNLLIAGMVLAGATLAIGGVVLITAGGSFYYLLAGAAVLVSAVALFYRRSFAVPVFGVLLALTLLWALWEVGFDGWALVPRLVAPAVLGLLLMLPPVRRRAGSPSAWWIGAPVLGVALVFVIAAVPSGKSGGNLKAATVLHMKEPLHGQWPAWGRSLAGDRFSPVSQINTGNVKKLKVAWRFKSNVPAYGYHSFEATPLAVNGMLYVCLDRNVIVALDPDTGKQIWRFNPHTNLKGVFAATCRGVAYYEAAAPVPDCPKRILFGVNDDRLAAVDADTGKLCKSFGKDGFVNMKEGLGKVQPGIVFPTSPPTVVDGVAIISGWVTDGLSVNEPSGVIRAYDAVTGKLRWAWDTGRADPQKPLAPGQTYTRGAPNAWGVFSADAKLGLVYFGTGVTTPDYYGSHRTANEEKYDNSIVALDIKTGQPRWHFQTVHHDRWDYDVSPQPVLVDLPKNGKSVPALIEATKRGQFFVLDRRNGRPVYPVTEKPVPQGAAPGDWAAKTQPYSSFPNVAGPKLTATQMWGITPLDQLWCRIKFRQARYDGDFTPPGLHPAIFYPGSAGGVNWGSVTVDTARDLMVTNSLYMPDIGWMISRADMRKLRYSEGGGHADAFAFPQKGTPFAMHRAVFLNPLGVPCKQPPYGRISVINLKTGKFLWSRKFGTAFHAGPLGLSSFLPFTMGVPNLGGSIATAGGLVFIGAAQDRKFRAYDIGDGKVLWSYALPYVGAATPMTYVSKKTGRQYVVIASGGHPGIPGPLGATLFAFALPKQK